MPKPVVAFDADALTVSLEAPALTIGGVRYEGRLLSIEEWLPFLDRVQAIQRTGKTEMADVVTLYRDYMRAVFPRSRFKFWAPDPVPILMRQPFTVVRQAFDRFFSLQALAMGAPALSATDPSLTIGTDSPPSTTEPARRAPTEAG